MGKLEFQKRIAEHLCRIDNLTASSAVYRHRVIQFGNHFTMGKIDGKPPRRLTAQPIRQTQAKILGLCERIVIP